MLARRAIDAMLADCAKLKRGPEGGHQVARPARRFRALRDIKPGSAGEAYIRGVPKLVSGATAGQVNFDNWDFSGDDHQAQQAARRS